MTTDDMQTLKALADKATPGPWQFRLQAPARFDYELHRAEVVSANGDTVMDDTEYYPIGVSHEDQKFCAAARTAVPALIAEVERLRVLVEAAYEEGRKEGGGQAQGGFCTGDYPESWAESAARKALGGA